MTDAVSVTRMYALGEQVPEGDYAIHQPYTEWCNRELPGGWYCSIKAGHTGHQHVAVGGNTVRSVEDRDTSADPIEEIPTREVLAERLAVAQREAERLQAFALRAEQALADARGEHDEFRDTVRSTAIRLAREHNWCSVVDAALREMGLEPMRQTYDVEVVVTATRTITVRIGEVDFDGSSTSDVHEAIGWPRVDEAFRAQESNSGWSTTEYDVQEWSVVND